MIISTKHKIAGARFIYRILRGFGFAAEPGQTVQIQRSGMLWNLDLGEGIDFSIYLFGAFETSTVRALQCLVQPGDTVLDIGANIGAHTLHLARSVGPGGRVYAFEPTNYAFAKLRQNLALNPTLLARVTPLQMLLVDRTGRPSDPEVYSSWPLEGMGDLHPQHLGKLQSTSNAVAETLDHFIDAQGIRRVDLIKLDVDGHEYSVLKGGIGLIEKFKPAIVMELSPYVHSDEGSFEDLVALLRESGYQAKRIDTRRSLALDAAYLQKVVPGGASINVVLYQPT